ncbi:MAG: hypothetical protein ACP5EN_02445 [Rhodovulum sp.]
MEKISITLKNCYGINSLFHEFDFTKKHAALIYAPNGIMKTSFAQTFKDLSTNSESKDRVYPDRPTSRLVVLEDGTELESENVFVVEPYDADYSSDKVSSLLVNKDLKKEYDEILKEIDNLLSAVVNKVRKSSGIRSGLEELISTTFSKRSDNLLRALDRIRAEVLEDEIDEGLANVPYAVLFNEKVEKLISNHEIKSALEEYTANYDNLLSKSRFFRKGVFNHYQATEVAKQLKAHGFFKADHKVFLNDGSEETEVKTEEELQALISSELNAILADPKLKSSFDELDKKISNRELRDFREFLLANQTIIPRLMSPELLKEDILKYHLMQSRAEFEALMTTYDAGKKRLDEIAKAASDQATKWQDVIGIFNRRFSVPFKVIMQNKEDVILKRATPNIGFEFQDQSLEPKSVERSQLVEVLSNGERRALYILNIIFEVQARMEQGLGTLFIIDDIADSFDYKNKYAIIEYLADVLREENFRQIILTHNYDFYRTVWKRLQLDGANYQVAKTKNEIVINNETMYRDPFDKWKKSANHTEKRDCLFAMIPFVRNLAGYCGFGDEEVQLTLALHIKLGEPDLTVGAMLEIFKKVLNGQVFEAHVPNDSLVIDEILAVADDISKAEDPALDLEKKVVLAIAIRLRAERFMISKINDDEWVKKISRNQTAVLAERFKTDAQNDASMREAVRVIDRVNLMTPENIHLNSFMYEPILDMSAEHLKVLLQDVRALAA